LSRDKSSRKPAVLFLSGASGDTLRYRVSHQAESLRLQGWYVETLPAEALEESHAEAFSFFILHRVSYSHEVAYFIRKAQALGKIVIFDIDDLLFGETHFSQMHRLLFSRKSSKEWEKDHARHYGKVLSLCNAATVTTRALQQSIQARFPHAPAFVMKNTVSAEMRGHAHKAICEQCDTRTKNITIGYFSGTPTHDVDFLSCAKSLQSILEEDSSVRLRICGYLQIPDFLEHLHAQIEHIPFVPWQQVSAIIASTSINLAPLECGNSFAEAKSELKYLEAAIVGVPTVASATDAFRSAIIHGKNGFLCSSDDQWQASLRSLIRDSDLRKSIGENAKKDVLKRYTTEVRGEELADLLMQISTQKHSYALSSACVA
jgi:glycosyltransferase involved in cell wall biosynthesis